MSQSARPVYNWTLDLKQGSITAEVFGDIQPVSVNVTSTMTLPGSCKAGVTPCVARRDFRLVTGNTEWDPCPYLPGETQAVESCTHCPASCHRHPLMLSVDIFGQGCLRPINWMGHAILPVFQVRVQVYSRSKHEAHTSTVELYVLQVVRKARHAAGR